MAHMIFAPKHFLPIALIAFIVLLPPAVLAQKQTGPIIIRDTEIENSFKEWMTPLLKASDLGLDKVNLVLVQSPQVNAFVAGGANIFVYTGLIEKTEEPGELIGVLAHELGHIAGGHLISTRSALERASYESILGTVLGIGTAIVTGNGAAANAIISGSNSVAGRRFLAHSRINESSADQAALRYFEGADLNPNGLKSFLEKLEDDELLPADKQSEYVRTHPITSNRIEALETRIEKSPAKNATLPKAWTNAHARMKAKLIGFIDPGRVQWAYNDRDQSIPARYARAIAAYRQNKIDSALKGIDALIQDEPRNPYFKELKGQMLRDFGRLDEALPYYQESVKMLPDAGLIRIDLAHVLMQSRSPNIDQAITHLKRALIHEPRSMRAHRLLATAYGRRGDENLAKLHLAEEALLQQNLPYAKRLAENLSKEFEENSQEWLKTKDILAHIENLERRLN